MRSIVTKYKIGLFILIISMIMLKVATYTHASDLSSIPQEAENILTDYSHYLETGETIYGPNYSSEMLKLVDERRSYYQEFFNNALHSNLLGLKSEFRVDNATITSQKENMYTLHVGEKIIMHGNPKVMSPDDYPLIQSAKWALTETVDEGIRNRLNEYILSMQKGVTESIQNGVEIEFFVQHDIDFDVIDGHNRIIKDTFSDKANDNGEGYDIMRWTEQGFERYKPDWWQFPDYEMYLRSIEDIGHALMVEYQAFPKSNLSEGTVYAYDYDAAVDYIVQYTSNPDFYDYCNWLPHVLEDKSFWNPAYEYLWGEIDCNDCADYVSQALLAGGLPQDDVWKPYLVPAWVRPFELMTYLVSADRGIVH